LYENDYCGEEEWAKLSFATTMMLMMMMILRCVKYFPLTMPFLVLVLLSRSASMNIHKITSVVY
jgi:hypothetical protein